MFFVSLVTSVFVSTAFFLFGARQAPSLGKLEPGIIESAVPAQETKVENSSNNSIKPTASNAPKPNLSVNTDINSYKSSLDSASDKPAQFSEERTADERINDIDSFLCEVKDRGHGFYYVEAFFPEFIESSTKNNLKIIITDKTVFGRMIMERGKIKEAPARIEDIRVKDRVIIEPTVSDIAQKESVEAKKILIPYNDTSQ